VHKRFFRHRGRGSRSPTSLPLLGRPWSAILGPLFETSCFFKKLQPLHTKTLCSHGKMCQRRFWKRLTSSPGCPKSILTENRLLVTSHRFARKIAHPTQNYHRNPDQKGIKTTQTCNKWQANKSASRIDLWYPGLGNNPNNLGNCIAD